MWAEAQRDESLGVTGLVGIRARLIDHECRMRRITSSASISEMHAVVKVHELRARELSSLVLEKEGNPVQGHG